MADKPLKILALNCSLKGARNQEKSSTQVLLEQVMEAFAEHNAKGDIVRVVDLNIKPGVKANEGRGDDWPKVRERLLAADILVIGTPIWMGQPGSVAKRVCERMDAFLDETDEVGRMPTYGKVGAVVVVGNEDGAHHVSAELYQVLNDVGFSLAPNAVTYWVGEAMGDKDYKDLLRTPKTTAGATAMLASNATHLARLLKDSQYPGSK